jgi:hypothetical protein
MFVTELSNHDDKKLKSKALKQELQKNKKIEIALGSTTLIVIGQFYKLLKHYWKLC